MGTEQAKHEGALLPLLSDMADQPGGDKGYRSVEGNKDNTISKSLPFKQLSVIKLMQTLTNQSKQHLQAEQRISNKKILHFRAPTENVCGLAIGTKNR